MNLDFRFYWTLFLRRLPVMTAVFLLCAGIGVALAFKLPTTYSTTARMMVETPQIAALQGGQIGGAELLDSIQQRLMTRANLLEIARRFRVFGENPNMTPDEVVEAMRAATDIKRVSGRDRATGMSVSFNARAPRIAADVVNAYVTLIDQESKRLRESQTDKTLEFFSQEVDRLSQELDLQSARIVEFKSLNAGSLPDSLDYRLNRESQLQERVALAEREIASLNEQRRRIVDIYETTGRVSGPQQQKLSPEEQRLAQLQSEMQGLLAVYSESHPRVRALQGQISQLEARIAGQGGAAPEDTNTQESILNLYLAEIDSKIETLQQTRDENTTELASLRKSIEQTAANGIALDALERDYANAQSLYNAAILQRNQAQVDQKADSSQLGGRISVIESASVPNRPSSPNRPLVATGGVLAGLGAMAGLFLLLELLNRTIRRPVELTHALGVTPLATIPYMETRAHFWMRRSLKLALLIAVVIAVPVALWAVDTYYKPLDLIYGRLLRQIGL